MFGFGYPHCEKAAVLTDCWDCAVLSSAFVMVAFAYRVRVCKRNDHVSLRYKWKDFAIICDRPKA